MVQKFMPFWGKFMDELYDKIGTTGMKHLEELENKLI